MAKIGIVGGGIAGLYCARELLRKHHVVTIYECLERLGGRIETQDLHGFKAECGPMRFERKIEPLFEALTKELEVEFSPFTPPRSGVSDFPKYDLRANEMSAEHKQAVAKGSKPVGDSADLIGNFSQHTSALDLLRFGIYRVFHHDAASLKLTLDEVVSGNDKSKISEYAKKLGDVEYDYIRTKQELYGVHLHNLGFWNALSRVLSPGAIAKIRETGTFYHLLPENPSAAEWSIFWLRLFRPDADLWTIKDGVEIVVKRLEAEIRKSKRLTIFTRTTIEGIIQDVKTGNLRLRTASGILKPRFDHVILAVPAVPLRELSDAFPREIRSYVSGVIPFPLLKVFVVIRDPWWVSFPQPQEGAHLVPTREVHYFPPESGTKGYGMVMFYTDRPATSYWHPYVNSFHDRAQIGQSQELEHELALQLARLLPQEGRDDDAHVERVERSIVSFAIRDWSAPPFGAASHAWAPRLDVPEALNQLKAFSLTGASGKKNVHICGEAYSDYQGFIEGALRTAASVVNTITD